MTLHSLRTSPGISIVFALPASEEELGGSRDVEVVRLICHDTAYHMHESRHVNHLHLASVREKARLLHQPINRLRTRVRETLPAFHLLCIAVIRDGEGFLSIWV